MVSKEFNPSITHPAYLIKRYLLRSISTFANHLKGDLLDVGCGVKPYESLFSVNSYVGMDFHGEGETYSKEKVDVFYDGKTFPFPDNSFDSVFSSEVFEHIFNPDDIISEIYRVLRPGGTVLITCPFTFPEHEIPNDYCRYSSYGVKELFKKHQFSILEYHKTGNAILAVAQLKSIYWNNHILSKFNSIPIVRSILRNTFFFLHHSSSLMKSKLLPGSTELFLSNVLLLKKAG